MSHRVESLLKVESRLARGDGDGHAEQPVQVHVHVQIWRDPFGVCAGMLAHVCCFMHALSLVLAGLAPLIGSLWPHHAFS